MNPAKLLAQELAGETKDEATLLAEKSLAEFIRQAWHVVEPSTEYVPGFHIDAIAEHLEAVHNRELRNLLINIPPRFMKSLAVNVFYPGWTWIKKPGHRFLTASYAASLTVRDNIKFRNIIQSQWYQNNWGDNYKLSGDQNTKIKVENDRRGYRIATSVGGVATGDGGDDLIIDDAHNVNEIESDIKRESVLNWFTQVWSSRLNDPKTGANIIVMQRSHHKDLSGYVIAKNLGYEHLCLPMEFEPSKKCFTSIGWEDPRTKEDELLWPVRYGKEEIDRLKLTLIHGYAGQCQQRPTAKEGAILKRGYWKFYKVLPPKDEWQMTYQSWDTAYEAKQTSDYWACKSAIKTATRLYIRPDGYFMQKMETPEGERKIKTLYQRDKPDLVLIEKKASGQSIVQSLSSGTDIPVKPVEVHRDKVARAQTAAPKVEAGLVLLPDPDYFPEASWVDNFIEHCATFPRGGHDDDIDDFTQLVNYIWSQGVPDIRSLDDDEPEKTEQSFLDDDDDELDDGMI